MYIKFNRLLLPIMLLFCTVTIFGQVQDNSPFSRFGIGNLLNTNYAPIASFGNVSATYQSPYHLNPGNPASYSALGYTSYEIGAFAKFTKAESASQELRAQTGNLSYLALGFPVFNPLNRLTQKKDYKYDWGISLGLRPYTQVAYDIIDSTDYGGEIGRVQNSYIGEGQLYKLHIGSGWDYKGFAAGFNVNYIFGRNRYNTQTTFIDNPTSLDNLFNDETHTSGFNFDIGVQYRKAITKETEDKKDQTFLIVGARVTPQMKVRNNSKYTEVVANFVSGSFYADTLFQVDGLKEKTTLPTEFSAGIALEKPNKYFVGINYEFGDWASYERPSATTGGTVFDDMTSSWTIGMGAEITPDARSYNSYLKRIRYRVGGFYGQDPRVIKGSTLNNYGITFGFGLPIQLPNRLPSFINLGFEFGRLGTLEVIQESYFKTTVAFTLNDNSWFYKRKFK